MPGSEVRLRIAGHDLPGRAAWGCTDAHLGMQRAAAFVDLVPADADEAVFDLAIEVVRPTDGDPDFRGPFVHGRRGDRFLYLAWVERPEYGETEMVARVKLFLNDIDPTMLAAALDRGGTLQATLALTAPGNTPVSAGIRPPKVAWTRMDVAHE